MRPYIINASRLALHLVFACTLAVAVAWQPRPVRGLAVIIEIVIEIGRACSSTPAQVWASHPASILGQI